MSYISHLAYLSHYFACLIFLNIIKSKGHLSNLGGGTHLVALSLVACGVGEPFHLTQGEANTYVTTVLNFLPFPPSPMVSKYPVIDHAERLCDDGPSEHSNLDPQIRHGG